MKAYNINRYGEPGKVLLLKDVEKPEPKNTEVQVKVRATTINDYDWSITTGKPFVYQLFFGIFKPRKKLCIPGMELAGIVEKIGSNATKFKPGDSVYGDISEYGFGSFAEFICIDEKALAHKPVNMSFEEAVAIPHAAMLALQGLRDIGQIKADQNILINGGGGGVGSFGLQLAKLHNAKVTGVDTGEKLKFMREQGYDQVIDYKEEDFTKNAQQYDLILDCKTNRSPWRYLRALKPGGKYISIGGRSGKLLLMLFLKPLISLLSNKSVHMVALKSNKDLAYINKLYEDNQIKCVIDGPYAFDKIPWAVQHFGEGLHNGKVVIPVN